MPENIPEQLQQNLERPESATDPLNEQEITSIARRIGSLVLDDETVLREHQQEAFDDIIKFYQEGGRETYVTLPTGTGKTVLFVELSRRLIESGKQDGKQSRILVLAPSIDLVDQTVGSIDEDGKRRGFKGFAPDLLVDAFHGRIPEKVRDSRLLESEVLVATYSSFRNIVNSFKTAETKTEEEWLEEAKTSHKEAVLAELEYKTLQKESTEYIKKVLVEASLNSAKTEIDVLKEKCKTDKKLAALHRAQLATLDTLLKQKNTPKPEMVTQIATTLRRMIPTKARRELKELRTTIQSENKGIKFEIVEEKIKAATEEYINNLDDFDRFIFRHLQRTYRTSTRQFDDLNESDILAVREHRQQLDKLRGNQQFHTSKEKAARRFAALSNHAHFDLIICDEAHRSIGSETWNAIRKYAEDKDIALLGLTATDEYYDRNLRDYFEAQAHDLPKQEAMKRQIVNPVALFVHETGLRFQNVGIDASGDYDRLTIREMRFSDERNRQGAAYARLLSEQGYSGIMSAIAGDDGHHAVELAELLNNQDMTDPKTGELRKMRAVAVLHGTKDRGQIYKDFERGKIDWLTFVDVIREGWDSDKAKALINMRPTRSPLLATQRLGRIGRTEPGAPVSIVIDMYDGIEGQEDNPEIPPVLGVDVFSLENTDQGYIVGSEQQKTSLILEMLKQKMTEKMIPRHNRFVKALETAYNVDRRGIPYDSHGKPMATSEWQSFESLRKTYRGFMPKELLVEAVNADPPLVRARQGRQGQRILPLFNVRDIQELQADKPEINPWKLFIDDQNQQWIAAEGCTTLLSKRLPHIQATDVTDAIRNLEDASGQPFTKTVGKVRLAYGESTPKHFGLVHIYKLEEVVERLVPFLTPN